MSIAEGAGLATRRAKDGKEALEMIAACQPNLVLTDLMMPRIDGLELVDRIGERYPHIPVLLMTSSGSQEIAMEARSVSPHTRSNTAARPWPPPMHIVSSP